MVTQRKWPMADWKRFFLQNPLANAFAKNFVWGIIKQNQLTATFYLSGHKLLDIEDVEVDLDEKDKIVLVHPLMIEETNDEWRSKLKAINIEPPFAQLNREVFKPDGAEMARKISYTFENKSMEGQTFKSRAYKFGWRRGSVIDSGVISSYRRSFDTLETDVFIMLDGLSVIPFESEITFKEFFFVKQGSVDTGSYVYDEPRNEKDHRLIKFGDVNPIVYSETLYDLQRILQTETNQE